MGKKKQAQRTKNNVVPASSGRSAELLQSVSGAALVGFSALKDGGFVPTMLAPGDEPDAAVVDDEFRLVLKKMNKKDVTTKLKALDEFARLCGERDADVSVAVLPYWPRLFGSLATDEENRVREAAHAAHRALVCRVGRNVAPHLKRLVGPWFTGQHDTYAPAASVARAAFQEAFPRNKYVEAVVFCREEILTYISDNLLNQTPHTLAASANQSAISDEAKRARHQRAVVGCLNGYALYVRTLPADALRTQEEANRRLVAAPKFWKFIKDPAPIVRAAWLSAVVALLERAPFLLSGQSKSVCSAVFTDLSDTDPAVVPLLWQAVLLVLTVLQDVWQCVSLDKLVVPGLVRVMRSAGNGCAAPLYPTLLPVLSRLPVEPDHRPAFYAKFFDALRAGLKVRSVQSSASECAAVVSALLECVRYVVAVNADRPELCADFVQQQLLPVLDADAVAAGCDRTWLCAGVAHLALLWTAHAPSLADSIWRKLAQIAEETDTLAGGACDPAALQRHCRCLAEALVAIGSPHAQPRRQAKLKVKFASANEVKEEVGAEETAAPAPTPSEEAELPAEYRHRLVELVPAHLARCLALVAAIDSTGTSARSILLSHFATLVRAFAHRLPPDRLLDACGSGGRDWYRGRMAAWLSDEGLPLGHVLDVVFALLERVGSDDDRRLIYSHLEECSTSDEKGEPKLEPLSERRWSSAVEWALQRDAGAAACRWLAEGGALQRVVARLTVDHTAFPVVHRALRNLGQNGWLTANALAALVDRLREVAGAGAGAGAASQLLSAMLLNPANASIVASIGADRLAPLLAHLLASDWPPPPCWRPCLNAVVLATADDGPSTGAAAELCVDRLFDAIDTRSLDVVECRRVGSLLEEVAAAVGGGAVLRRATARLSAPADTVWRLYAVTRPHTTASHGLPLLRGHPKDPLADVPLAQYVSWGIPLLHLVVGLVTRRKPDEDGGIDCGRVRDSLEPGCLLDCTLRALQLRSVCLDLRAHYSGTKQYFRLKDKISFVLKECGLLSQLDVADLIKHMDLGDGEDASGGRCRAEAVLRDLHLTFDLGHLKRALAPVKAAVPLVRRCYFPDEVLDELSEPLAAGGRLAEDKLALIVDCTARVRELGGDVAEVAPRIVLMDAVFDQFVARHKENRALDDLSDGELDAVAAAADWTSERVVHESAHMAQSSWDSALVAAAALTLSLDTTVVNMVKKEETAQLARALCAICRLFDAVSRHMEDGEAEGRVAERRRAEWTDVFLPGSHTAMAHAWFTLADGWLCDRPSRLLLLDSLGSSVCRFVRAAPYFAAGTGGPAACLSTLCRLLQSPVCSVQIAAHSLLIRLMPSVVELDAKEEEEEGGVALSCRLVDDALVYTQTIVDAMLSGLCVGDTCIVEPFTDSYAYGRCFLLLWSALLEMCACANAPTLRSLYTTWLKEQHLPALMRAALCLMPESALHADVPSARVAQLFNRPPDLNTAGAVWDSDRLAGLACRVFAEALRRLPAAVRQWWTETNDHRVSALIDRVTTTYVSPELAVEEMRALHAHDKRFDNMTVHVLSGATRSVHAVYTLEDCRMELELELAPNHPLGLVRVRAAQPGIVSTQQTRQWIMQITVFLTHQNGSLWEALELWKTSLDKRFDGVEECYICFAVLHPTTTQLPKLSCQTCRKKFHSHCLYKWFTTSNKSTCPICRNLF